MAGKGNPKTGGRQKGVSNKVTAEVKEMVIQALTESGGVDYLKIQAMNNPNAFMSLVGKVLPLQVTGANGDPLKACLEVAFVSANKG